MAVPVAKAVVLLWKKLTMRLILPRGLSIGDILSPRWVARLIVWATHLTCGESSACLAAFTILLALSVVRDRFCSYLCKFHSDIAEVSTSDKFSDVCD